MRVDKAMPDDWREARALRLAALAEAPDAFATTLAEELGRPDLFWQGRLRNERVTTLIARDEGRPVGIAVVGPYGERPEEAGLFSVWVAPEARGHGAGTALVAAAIEVARAADIERLLLEVGDHNTSAIRLYARFGFEPTGRTSTLPRPREHLTEHERVLDLART